MTKFFLVAAAALSAVTTPALAETAAGMPFSFRADGRTFDVVRIDTAKGAILTGVDSNRNAFRLVVVGKHVSGTYGSGQVEFDIAAPIAPQQIALK